ncbi:MAG TPA: IS1182 family transposase [Noviherbaspirillum sp.]|jgi:transposase|uniref:IS1182 family transposase n=1 Tax=Noviherbaspirillum sp. TaxID=1926288 RepID=UPI002DDD5138|nr:IS1182 family transposase [Noviherbaspirillum sp.]HEV2608802.1 IS1182 family transposase [Noviherbaspirillum sp.]
MMGRKLVPRERTEIINLEEFVPQDHLLRGIDRYLDLAEFREHLKPFYSHIGRPSVDPELIIRMLIIGYCYGIRSERRLCEEVHLNLAYRWFCHLGIHDRVPDHSTFSKTRHGRFRDSDAFRDLFESVLRRCILEGMVGGEGFATDASVIKADARRQRAVRGTQSPDWGNPEQWTRPVREYLAALDATNTDTGLPKSISLTDPCASWTATAGPAFFAYSTNYLVDVKAGVIVDVEPSSSNRTCEVQATRTMIDRVGRQFQMTPQRLIGDMAYGSATMLGWLVKDKGIEPHVPVWDKSERTDDTFGRSDFFWDQEANVYHCPGKRLLHGRRRVFANLTSAVTKADTIIYRASQADCQTCSLKVQCCPNTPFRKIARSIHEDARDLVRRLMGTPQYQQSRCERKKVEMLFAHLKRIIKLDRLRLRGPTGAHDEFLLAATAQNLRRLAKLLCLGALQPTKPAG